MKLPLSHAIYRQFLVLLLLHALAAYALAGVPFPWFAQAGAIALALYTAYRAQWFLPPGFLVFSSFLAYASLLTFSFSLAQDYSVLMPDKATTSYSFFIFLRFLQMGTFGSVLLLTYWICRSGNEHKLAQALTDLGVLIAVFSIYVYIAQLFGLPEPPRTRMGTGGGEQSTVFTYAFHRAMGPFREPSHLAEWLVVPLFCSFMDKRKGTTLKTLLLAGTLFLTGSLTGLVSSAVGILVVLIFGIQTQGESIRKLIKAAVPITLSMVVFSSVVVVNSTGSQSGGGAFSALWKRLEPLFDEKGQGVKKTNRNYVYDYLEKRGLGFIGPGLGNSNLEFTKAMHLDATASFLNLYVNVGVSLGLLGLAILGLFLVIPLLKLFKKMAFGIQEKDLFYLGAYVAWLIIFVIHSEELSFHFGVIYALLVYSTSQRASVDA